MIQFANQYFLYALLIIPILVIIFIFARINKKKALQKFGDDNVISSLMPLASRRRPLVKFILMLMIISLIIVAIARPQRGSKRKTVKAEGVEIVIALDVSNSMLAQDVKPNRLAAAKHSISRMLEQLDNDKIGLIVFAGKAYTQVPVTTDYTATKMLLQTIDTDVVNEQGTAIGEAIELASKSFTPNEDATKVLIIITDGENHEDNPVEAAKVAAEKGIIIYTIGLGDINGSPIPTGSGTNYRKDRSGHVIMSKLDEKTLVDIASAANGKYIRANNISLGLKTLYKEIDNLDKQEMESVVFDEYEDFFQYLIGLAIILFLLDYFIMDRKNKKLEKFKLYKLGN